MQVRNDTIDAIGHTPLIKLKRASEQTGCTIFGKAEFMNPGGSVKDRPGRQMILEAENRGELHPGFQPRKMAPTERARVARHRQGQQGSYPTP